MLTDDDCRAIREAIGQPAMSFDRVRELVRAINAMPDGPVYVVPREASEGMQHLGKTALPNSLSGRFVKARFVYDTMTAAGAAEVGRSDNG